MSTAAGASPYTPPAKPFECISCAVTKPASERAQYPYNGGLCSECVAATITRRAREAEAERAAAAPTVEAARARVRVYGVPVPSVEGVPRLVRQ